MDQFLKKHRAILNINFRKSSIFQMLALSDCFEYVNEARGWGTKIFFILQKGKRALENSFDFPIKFLKILFKCSLNFT